MKITAKILADYVSLGVLMTILLVYCVLIFVSRSVLGAVPAIILLTLGGIAFCLLIKSARHMSKRKRRSLKVHRT